jgi:CDP-6-deoxy-D-xylo-4-hexulose-3-dehydrase
MKKYSLVKETISKKEIINLSNWIKRNKQLTKGKLTNNFENKFSNFVNKKYSVFVNSGSSANLLMIYSLLENKKLQNRKAIISGVSWATTVAPFMQLNFDISLCDCDKINLSINLEHFEYLCKKNNPSVAVIVNVLGHTNDIKKITQICKKYNVVLLEDSCGSLGTVIDSKKQNLSAMATSYSFYYGHHMSTIEGGMVCTNDYNLYNIMLSVRSHGWIRDLKSKFKKKLLKKYKVDEFRNLYTFYYAGYNFRSTEINAYLGLGQLKKIRINSKIRNDNFNYYKKILNNFWFQYSDVKLLSSFAYATIVKNPLETYKYLKKFNIETRPLICGNIGRHPFWVKRFKTCKLKNADIIHKYGIYLPNHQNMTVHDIKYICKKFLEIAKPMYFE